MIELLMRRCLWLEAMWVLEIWSPEKFYHMEDGARKRQRMLSYKARGIVLFDRAINDELKEE